MRKTQQFKFELIESKKLTILQWASHYEKVIWLDGNKHNDRYGKYDALLAVGANATTFESLDVLKKEVVQQKDWLFGYFSYDLKNDLESLISNNFDGLHFPKLHFFVPDKVILFKDNYADFQYLNNFSGDIKNDFDWISGSVAKEETPTRPRVKIRLRIQKDAYFKKVGELLHHIYRGDVYEANFCQEFYAEQTAIDPVQVYQKLNSISSPPFAAFLRLNELFLMSASPERYICKSKNKIISQPIKGTAPRSSNPEEDMKNATELSKNIKEMAENIMITDLVRNDLSRIAKRGSVNVEELCKVYTYRQVHQMISTIACEVDESINPLEIVENTFPMGSMTGAPKIAAMQVIEALEETKRGVYSGAVGYFTPEGDFDFNVVIRSILYNSERKYVSYSVGSAITAKSDIEKEYQECLLKAKALRRVLEG